MRLINSDTILPSDEAQCENSFQVIVKLIANWTKNQINYGMWKLKEV